MLHMKLNSAVSVFAVAAAFSVLLPPSNAYCGVCFLPDCQDSDTLHGDVNMNVNNDTEWCEKKGYTYYASGKCPQYQAQVGKCKKDDYYLKCDPVKWCTDNGYNTQTCSLPSFVNDQCPNGKPYYKGCKEDRPRACRETGYVNSCSPGRLYATTNRCPYDKSFGKCCTASPSTGCPSSYAVTCDPARGSSGTDTCGYTCYRCCDDTCPSGTSKNYTGSYARTTECGSRCNRCKDCSSGETYWNGSYVGSSECGSCYSCSDTCRSGTKGGVSCSGNYVSTRISSTECGSGCYECRYNTDCNVTSKSCDYGCAYTNSCGKCTSCKSAPPPPANPWVRYRKHVETGSRCVDSSQAVCKSDGRICISGSQYLSACRLDFGCYNKNTGEYKSNGEKNMVLQYNGAPVFSSYDDCKANKTGDCYSSSSVNYMGTVIGITSTACNSDGTTSDFW